MFWVFLLSVSMIVVLLKLGAASVTVNVLSIALIVAGVVRRRCYECCDAKAFLAEIRALMGPTQAPAKRPAGKAKAPAKPRR